MDNILNKEKLELLGFQARIEIDGSEPYLYKLDISSKPLFPQNPGLTNLYLVYRGSTSRCLLFLQQPIIAGKEDEARPEVVLFNGFIANEDEFKTILKHLGVNIE